MMTAKTISISFLFFFSIRSYAQQNHFIYIKADNGKKFSATTSDSTYNAIAGFVIIPRLKNGEYNFSLNIDGVGNPKHFDVAVNNTDYGFALKNLGEKGWCLYDYNTAAIIMAMPDKPGEDVFGSMLSQVTNDSSIIEYAAPVMKKTEPINTKDTAAKIPELLPISVDSSIIKDSGKEQNAESILFDSVVTVTLDTANLDKKEMANPFFETEEFLADTLKNIDSIIAVPEDKTAAAVIKEEVNCTKNLSDQELAKLRGKMFATSGDEKMIAFAVKSINEKCITTMQTKALGLLFSTDSGRYHFFEALHKNIVDKENLVSLESQLINSYYKKLFRALIQ